MFLSFTLGFTFFSPKTSILNIRSWYELHALGNTGHFLPAAGLIFAALSSPVFGKWRSAGSFPGQRLLIEPSYKSTSINLIHPWSLLSLSFRKTMTKAKLLCLIVSIIPIYVTFFLLICLKKVINKNYLTTERKAFINVNQKNEFMK